MGHITYGTDYTIEVDDRALAHLKIVILSKLRRDESFAFSWAVPTELGSGRETVWLHPSIPLRFSFSGSRPALMNRAWIAKMVAASAQSGDLILIEEPADDQPVDSGRSSRW